MECKYKQLLFRDTDGTPVYVCCKEGVKRYGKAPACDRCGEIEILQMDSGTEAVEE